MSTDTTSPEKATGDEPAHDHTDLSKFQLRALAVIASADEPPKGTRVKTLLAEYYGTTVHHGRVYPNLDDLADRGLIEVGTKDQRTNEYRITDAGRTTLKAEIDWLVARGRAARLGEEPAVMTDGGRNVAAGHELVTDGGVPEHLTPTNTIDGGTIYRCTRCGCEGERVVSHLDGCPAAPDGGDERVQPIATDGGAPQVAHLDRALEELRQARALAVAIETDAGAAIDERLRSASEELAALAEGSQ